jgi:hypothetical protein
MNMFFIAYFEGAGVPPIWKKEFMTLEGTKSFLQHSTGFVSGRFEDKGQGTC